MLPIPIYSDDLNKRDGEFSRTFRIDYRGVYRRIEVVWESGALLEAG